MAGVFQHQSVMRGFPGLLQLGRSKQRLYYDHSSSVVVLTMVCYLVFKDEQIVYIFQVFTLLVLCDMKFMYNIICLYTLHAESCQH